MGDEHADGEPGPRIALWQIEAVRSGVMEHWSVRWKVGNRGEDSLKILAARLPHGQFKSEEMRFEPPVDLPAGRAEQFQVSVRCLEPTGLVTENAFVIFHVIWFGQPWRVFARIRVVVNADGKPSATTESITTQKIGFSEVSS
jgi:hypothetical protein